LPDSDSSDFAPVFSLDEEFMYFISCKKTNHSWRKFNLFENRYDCDVFYRKKMIDGTWSESYNMGESFNNSQDQGNPYFTPNGEFLYFVSLGQKDTIVWKARANGDKFEQPRLVDGEIREWYEDRNEEKQDLVEDNWDDIKEQTMKNLVKNYGYSFQVNEKTEKIYYNELHYVQIKHYEQKGIPESFWRYRNCDFTIFPDGKSVIFSEDFGKDDEYGMFGKGGNDLYSCKIDKNGNWIDIKPLPIEINTAKNESLPFIASDGKTLYFNRDSFIYMAEKEGDSWINIIKLPEPINTDSTFSAGFKIMPSGKKAYFFSNRDGQSKIYEAIIPDNDQVRQEDVVIVKGTCIDPITQKPLKANVIIDNLTDNKNVVTVETNPNDGKYMASLIRGKDYGISIESEGYLVQSKKLEIPQEGDYEIKEINAELQPIKKGSRTELGNISFEFASDKLSPESFLELDRIVTMMKNNQEINILIEGHTDDSGTTQFNDKLSLSRASSVKSYLNSKGVDENRVKVQGFGESKPKYTGTDEEQKAMNRRVEILIL
jgi:outer membrane protein OmpA-like peptidoglycan-associated protein